MDFPCVKEAANATNEKIDCLNYVVPTMQHRDQIFKEASIRIRGTFLEVTSGLYLVPKQTQLALR
jgi:hypothetical protein